MGSLRDKSADNSTATFEMSNLFNIDFWFLYWFIYGCSGYTFIELNDGMINE